jgi:hypothetical protein
MTDEQKKLVSKYHRRHRGTSRQISYHGCGKYSVQFFDKQTSKLVADYNL